MKSTGLWVLLALIAIQANARLVRRGDSEEVFGRAKREVELHDWLTVEQKKELEPLKDKMDEYRAKVMEFYKQLPDEKQKEWNKFYKKRCVEWLKTVASEEERNELKQLKEKKDKETLLAKIRTYRARLPEDKRKTAEAFESECIDLWKDELSRKRRDIDKNFEEFTKWMTEEQKKEVSDLKASGKSFDELRKKTIEYFEALPKDKQDSLKEEFKGKCKVRLDSSLLLLKNMKAFFKKISTPEEMNKMKELHDSGNDDEVRSMVKDIISRLSGDEMKLAKKMEMLCTDVFAVKHKRRRDIDEKINRRLSWMTADQKEEIKQMHASGKSHADIRAKIFEYLSALEGPAGIAAKKQTQKECYKWMEDVATAEEIAALHEMHERDHDGCKKRHFGKEILGEENSKTLTEMKDSGASHEEMEKKVKEMVAGITDPEKRERAEKFTDGCKKIYKTSVSRRRRGQELYTLEKVLENYLTWLTDDQKAELKSLKEAGNKDEIYKKIVQYFDGTSGDTKKKALEDMQTGCKHYIRNVVGDEKADEFKQMRESGVPVDEIAKKIDAIVDGLTNEEVKTQAKKAAVICKAAFSAPKRFRRGQELYTLEKALEHYLTWLTDDQKNELKSLKESGDKDGIYKKVLEYYEAASGDVKKKATEDLQVGCKHYIRNVLGDEKADEFKHMRESGVSPDEIGKKIEALIEELDNAEVKAQAKKSAPICKAAFSAPKRFRREHHEHKMDEEMKKYLTWLTPDQHDKLKEKFEKEGREPGYKLVMEYFEASSGDVKTKATEELKAACKHFSKEILGEENTKALTELKESGASHDEMEKKVNEMVAGITDPKKKERAEKYAEGCKKIYKSSASRRRRGQELYTLEKVLENYLTWLTDAQKEELKSLKEAGNKDEIYKKIVQYFDGTTGETKKKALEDMQTGCRHYIRNVVGDEKADEFKQMKESGVSVEEIAKKIDAIVDGLTNEEVKTQAKKAALICKAAFSAPKRFRREQHEHKMDEEMKKYLTWLTPDQHDKLKEKFEKEGREPGYKLVMEFFEASSGDVKAKATEELKAACKHFGKEIIGEENVKTLTEMKESGASHDEMDKKVKEMVAGIEDPKKRERAEKYTEGCRKIYKSSASRRRRGQELYTLEKVLENYLTWLTEDQKAELKSLKEAGNKDEIYKKIVHYFDGTSGDTKKKALEDMQTGCKHYIRNVVGDEKADEFKQMRESGVPVDEIAKKIDEIVDGLTNEEVKTQAKKAAIICKAAFSAPKRFRREEEFEHTFEGELRRHAGWLTAEQTDRLMTVYKAEGKEQASKLLLEMFDSTTGEVRAKGVEAMKSACRQYGKHLLGEKNFETLKQMRED
ncbi:hypothetical protein OESDEN_10588, partial [Oesophagostomum dentatum]